MSVRELVQGIVDTVEGHSRDEPQRATLAAPLSTTARTLQMTSTSFIPPGVIEVGVELMFLESHATGVGTIAGWGRGYKGTSRFAHRELAEIIIHPRVPKSRVLSLANQIIDSLYPLIFRPLTTTFLYNAARNPLFTADTIIACPANPLWVGISGEQVGRYKWANGQLRLGTALSDGDALTMVTPGTGKRLDGVSWQNDAPFATATGLAPSVQGLVELGVLARLFASVEGTRVQPSTPESSDRAQVVGIGASASLAKLYQALFQQRMQVELQAQNERNPLTLTWSR